MGFSIVLSTALRTERDPLSPITRIGGIKVEMVIVSIFMEELTKAISV